MLNLSGEASVGEEGKDTRKTWTDMLVDSAIIGGIAVFATIGSMPATWECAWIAFKACVSRSLWSATTSASPVAKRRIADSTAA